MDAAGGKPERIEIEPDGPAEDVRLDRFAIGLSLLCLVHCLALPAALLIVPTLEDLVLGTESPFHWLLLGVAVPVSGYALWHGFRHHGQRNVLLIGGGGLAVMFFGVSHVATAQLETPLTVLGVAALLVAHVINLRLNLRCAHAE